VRATLNAEIRQISPDILEINERARLSREKSRKRDISYRESNSMSRLDPATITKRSRCHALIHGGREKERELPCVITHVRKNAFKVSLFFPK